MLAIRSIYSRPPRSIFQKRLYIVTVDLTNTKSWMKVYGKKTYLDSTTFEVWQDKASNQWRAGIKDVFRIPDTTLGCVDTKNGPRKEKLEAMQEYIDRQSIRIEAGQRLAKEEFDGYVKTKKAWSELFFNWNPCEECKFTQSCDKKFLATYVLPKLHVCDSGVQSTWILAMNVAAVVARLVHHYEPFDSAYYDKWDAIKKCSDCVFCQFVRRDNDPDCIDPVQGVVTYEGEQEVERANSIADLKDHRDMREKVPYTRCLLNGKMVHGDPKDLKMNDFTETSMEVMKGVCNQYIWRKTLYRKCLWVPASQSAEFSGKDIIAGTGDLQVIAKRVLKEEVSRVDEAERELCGSRTTN